MSELRFGIGLRRFDSVAEDARVAEALGYHFVVTGEHFFFYGPIGNGLIQLAAAAGATQSIQLMSTITLVPLYPAPLLAKLVSTLDRVSQGRFHLGVGVGGEFKKEFEALGVPVKERGRRTDEALTVMKKLWTEDDVHFDGRFTQLPGVTLDPKPLTDPHPPIWISGRSEAAMRRCAEHGNGWLPYMYTPEMVADSRRQIDAHAGSRAAEIESGLFIFFAVHEDRETAIEMAAKRLSKQYNQDFSKLVHRYALAGTPDDCKARLREYLDTGVRTVILNSACPNAYMPDNERLLAEEVLPAFR